MTAIPRRDQPEFTREPDLGVIRDRVAAVRCAEGYQTLLLHRQVLAAEEAKLQAMISKLSPAGLGLYCAKIPEIVEKVERGHQARPAAAAQVQHADA